jgi:glycosyltransferase involved in cell wall biosynthesis
MRSVDAVTVSGPLDADVLMQRYDLVTPPAVILNAPPYADVMASDVLRQTFRIPSNNVVLVYQGVVHHGRGIEPVMAAMVHMPDVHLCVIGDGPARKELEDRATALGVTECVHWVGELPYDEMHAWTCSADIGLTLIEDRSMSYAYALPNKLFEYMRARIPQLVSDLPAMHAMVHAHPVGILVDASLQSKEIVHAIQRLRNPGTRQAFVAQCEDIRQLSYERQAATLLDVYASLLER